MKQDKNRVSLHFTANAYGSRKLYPWVIGKFQKPSGALLSVHVDDLAMTAPTGGDIDEGQTVSTSMDVRDLISLPPTRSTAW